MNEHKLRNPFKTYDPTKKKLTTYEQNGIGDTTVIYTATEYNKRTIKDFARTYNKEILDIIKRIGYEYEKLTIEFYLLRRKAPTSRKAWDERSES